MSILLIGLLGRRRRHYWRLLGQGARRGLHTFVQAVTLAILGEHMIRYTEEVVLPRLDRTLAELDPAPAGEPAAPVRLSPLEAGVLPMSDRRPALG